MKKFLIGTAVLTIGLLAACGGDAEAEKKHDYEGTVREISYQEGHHNNEYTVIYEETTGCYALVLGSTWTSEMGSATVLKCEEPKEAK